jgi:hypothetical protein
VVAVTALACLGLTSPALLPSTARAEPDAQRCRLTALLVPTCGVLFGGYAEHEDGQSAEDAFLGFENLSQTHFNLLHYYHQGTELFPFDWEIRLAHDPDHPRTLLLNWRPEAGHSWSEVAAGAADWYIVEEADYLKANFTDPFFLVIHHEPENEVDNTPGSGYTADDYAAMYRHVEDRLKADGVHNAVYVMNYMGAQTYAQQPWYSHLWPGDAYVDWLGFDPYTTQDMGGQDGSFKHMVNRHWGSGVWRGSYRWARQHHPDLPIVLPEWGVGEKPGAPHWKAWFFGTVCRDLARFPQIKALSYFDSPHGIASGDVRPNTSRISLRGWIELAEHRMFHR